MRNDGHLRRALTLTAIVVLLSATPATGGQAKKGPVKVFILAGQSNMEGQGKIAADPKSNVGKGSLQYLVKDPATAARFKHMVDKDGKWIVRDDVWIWYLGRKGKLTVGYGAREDRIGPELGFGIVMGDCLDNQVLLVKVAWGGKSLAKDFRPPSSGGEVGPSYKELIRHVKEVLADLKSLFPDYDGSGYEVAGFGWHQGWNDRVNQAYNDEYEKNLANFIRDVRKDLGVPKLPFVIAETGMSGHGERHPRGSVPDACPGRRGQVRGVSGQRGLCRHERLLPSARGVSFLAELSLEQQRRNVLSDRHGDGRRDEEALRQVARRLLSLDQALRFSKRLENVVGRAPSNLRLLPQLLCVGG